jgi:hypothetical protein
MAQVETALADTLRRLRAVGLLSHLDEEQVQRCYQELVERQAAPAQLLYSLPDVVYGFDSEYWWNPTVTASYIELVSAITTVSRGNCTPQRVTVTPKADESLKDGDYLTLSFEFAGQRYTQQLEFWGDAVDLHIVDALNRALSDTDETGRYYWINTHDQMVVLIFLTVAQLPIVQELLGADLRPWGDIYRLDANLW